MSSVAEPAERAPDATRLKRGILSMRILGTLAVLFGVVGLWYNGLTAFNTSWWEPDSETPYFVPAFRILSAIYIALYIGLFIAGVQLVIARRPAWLLVLSGILVLEFSTFFAVSALWLFPVREVALSVGAATGVSCGGFAIQLITLFPFWGIVWACMTFRRTNRATISA